MRRQRQISGRTYSIRSRGRGAGTTPAAFTPASLPNAIQWLDASDTSAASIVASAGAVGTFKNKLANAYYMTAAGGQRPTTGSRTVNGLNALDFNGSSNFMSWTSTNLSDFLLGKDAMTLYLCSVNDGSGDGYAMCYINSAFARLWELTYKTGAHNAIGHMRDADVQWITFTQPPSTGNAASIAVLTIQRNGLAQLYSNGNTAVMQLAPTDNPFTLATDQTLMLGTFIDGFGFCDMAFCESLIASIVHSNSNINLMSNYLKAKWNAPWVNI